MICKSGNIVEIYFVKNYFFIFIDKLVKNYIFGVFFFVVV